jgi:UDP-N-acetyl-D-glucosamine dehydrogenase
LLVGLAYKANVDDDRESPGYTLLDMLKESGAQVAYYDPYVPVIRPTREHPHWAGTQSIPWTKQELASYDATLIATAHSKVNYAELLEWSNLIVDTRNAMAPFLPNAKVVKA